MESLARSNGHVQPVMFTIRVTYIEVTEEVNWSELSEREIKSSTW
jgi:hypothetical protein